MFKRPYDVLVDAVVMRSAKLLLGSEKGTESPLAKRSAVSSAASKASERR